MALNRKSKTIPFDWVEIEEGIKESILSQSNNIKKYGRIDGNSDEIHHLYLGYKLFDEYEPIVKTSVSIEKIDKNIEENYIRSDIAERIEVEYGAIYNTGIIVRKELKKHYIYTHVQIAYQYAYQCDNHYSFSQVHDNYDDVVALLSCYPQHNWDGKPTPFHEAGNHPLRKVLETFVARFDLFERRKSMTVRQLALLAGMAEGTVRTTLSQEGFHLNDIGNKSSHMHNEKSSALDATSAIRWLSRRKKFILQVPLEKKHLHHDKISEIISSDTSFVDKISELLLESKITVEQLYSHYGLDDLWITGLLNGFYVIEDVRAMKNLAKILSVSSENFIPMAIEHILSINSQKK